MTERDGTTPDATDPDDRARATVRTPVVHPEVVAAALRPDNTDRMTTRVADGAVVTTLNRGDAGGLRSTFDDYAVNLGVADTVAQLADHHTTDTHE